MPTAQRKKIGEIFGVLILLISLIVFLSLITYNPSDTSWSVSSTLESSHNFIGRVGAWTSDFLFQIAGLGAFALLIPLVVSAIKLIRKRPFQGLFSHFLGVFLVLLSLSGLAEITGIPVHSDANFSPGGIIGGALIHLLDYYLNRGGTVLVVATMLVVGLLLLTTRTLDDIWQRFIGHLPRPFRRRPKTDATPEIRRKDIPPLEKVIDPAPPLNITPAASDPPAAAAVKKAADSPSIPISRLVLNDTPVATDDRSSHPTEPCKAFPLPPVSLLAPASGTTRINETELMEKAQQIIRKYAEFGIEGSIDAIHPGPVVTLFEFKPAPGVKYSRMISLVDDLCLGLKAESIRIDRIPGKSTVGIEVPNSQRQIIFIRDLLESKEFQRSRSRLSIALGRRINGDIYVSDLAGMPHLLVAGATGSGKSVGLNTMITSILYKATPEEVRFIFIDPKRLELGMYEDIPHLLTPIVTDAKQAANTLIWAVHEMEERYKLLAKFAVKDILGFNKLCAETEDMSTLPYVVVVIDELAELLSVASKEVELCLQRLAQMARAVGIHLIIATQRPSVEVITGVIKANFPSRISFRLFSKHDSKTIIDTVGAENLLGKGDMLFLPPNSAKLIRVHGAFISEDETKRLVDYLKTQAEPDYMELNIPGEDGNGAEDTAGPADDPIYEEVARFVVKHRKASTSVLQRRFRIGYGRAARLMDILEDEGIVGESLGSRPREVLVPPDYFDEVDSTRAE